MTETPAENGENFPVVRYIQDARTQRLRKLLKWSHLLDRTSHVVGVCVCARVCVWRERILINVLKRFSSSCHFSE